MNLYPKLCIVITLLFHSMFIWASTPIVPASVTFCGKNIDLTRFDRHERMDRELLAFTYMHSTSIQ